MKSTENRIWLLALLATSLLISLPLKAQVTVGEDTAPQGFSLLEIISNAGKEGGLRLPQLTSGERDSVATEFNKNPEYADAARGLVIYNTETECLEFWNSSSWVSLCNSVEHTTNDETLAVDPGNLLFSEIAGGGGPQMENVITNVPAGWNITSKPDWVVTSPVASTRSTGTTLTVSVPDANTTGMQRVGVVTVTANTKSVSFTVTQEVPPTIGNVSSAPLLYLAPDGTLQLGRWGIEINRDNLLLFKFGGVVGFIIPTGTPNEDLNPAVGSPTGSRWADSGGANNVKFNPTNIATSNFADYTVIPYYSETLYTANPPVYNISDPVYHNGTNVKSGFGDPCKLIGYTAAQIVAMTPEQINALPSPWRLPTKIENISFAGADHGTFDNYVPNPPAATSGVANSARIYWGPSPNGGTGLYSGGWFPIGNTGNTTDRSTDANKFLPAAGYRGGDWNGNTYPERQGTARLQGAVGFFWSSTAYVSEAVGFGIQPFGYALGLDAQTVYPISYNRAIYGFPIRCVPNN